MGFLDSFLAWIILILVVAMIIFGVVTYLLGWFYSNTTEENRSTNQIQLTEPTQTEIDEQINNEMRQTSTRKRLIYIFAIVMIIIIATGGGINAITATNSADKNI